MNEKLYYSAADIAAMREVDKLEQQAVMLEKQNKALEQQNDDLEEQTSELYGKVQEMKAQNNELVLQAQQLTEQIEDTEAKENAAQEILAKHDIWAETFKMISKEVAAETKNMKNAAVPAANLFGGEEYVKVKKSDWNKMLDVFSKVVSRNHLLEKYEKKISDLEKKISVLTDQIEKLKRFIASRGLGEAFVEFVKSLAPKTMKQRQGKQKQMLRSITGKERAAGRTLVERISSGSRKSSFLWKARNKQCI